MQIMNNNPYEILHPTAKKEKPQGNFYEAFETIINKLDIYKSDQELRIEQFRKLEKSADIDNHIMVLNSNIKFAKQMAMDMMQLAQIFDRFENKQVTPEAIAEAKALITKITASRDNAISAHFISAAHLPTDAELNALREKMEYYQMFIKNASPEVAVPSVEPKTVSTKTAADFIENDAERKYAEAKAKYEKASVFGKAYLKLTGQANFKEMTDNLDTGKRR